MASQVPAISKDNLPVSWVSQLMEIKSAKEQILFIVEKMHEEVVSWKKEDEENHLNGRRKIGFGQKKRWTNIPTVQLTKFSVHLRLQHLDGLHSVAYNMFVRKSVIYSRHLIPE